MEFKVGDFILANNKFGMIILVHTVFAGIVLADKLMPRIGVAHFDGYKSRGYYSDDEVFPYETKINQLNSLMYPDYMEYGEYLIPKEAYETLTHKKK